MTIGERCPYSKKLNLHNLLDTPDVMAEFTIQKDDYIWTSRSLVLDEHDNIYVMSTSKDGLKIIKWSPVEGGK